MKILPKVYAKAQGEPFKVGKYKENKVEFYDLQDTKYYSRLVASGRFHMWTSDGLDYRLFIDRAYYEALSELYSDEMNEISLDYMMTVYGKKVKLRNKSFIWTLGLLVLAMAVMFTIQAIDPNASYGIFIGLAIMIVPYYIILRKERSTGDAFVREEHAKSSKQIRDLLGESHFEDLLTAQEAYIASVFATDEEEEALAEIETQDNEEDAEETLENQEDGSDNE